MKLFVGLGNPGARYAWTRHNIGFRIADPLARRCRAGPPAERFRGRIAFGTLAGPTPEPVGFLLPGTFMNASGEAVSAALDALPEIAPARDLLVACDDLDLPLGRIRLRASGGAGGHNGIASIIDALGTRDFPRLRFGIGRPAPGCDVTAFVLERFTAAEEALLPAPIARACAAAESALREGLPVAMDRFNGPPPPPESP